jgi:putative selenium metabolism hydrolase
MFGTLEPLMIRRARELASQRRNQVVTLAQRLVQTPSFSGQEGEVASLVVRAMTDAGFDRVSVDPAGNVIGWMDGRETRPLLMFNCHLDHVNLNGRRELWRHPPFSGTLTEGRLVGLGASDTKGALAAQIMSAGVLKEMSSSLGGTLCVTAVVAEEISTFGMEYLLEHTCRPDLVVLGEATNLGVNVGHRGSFGVTVQISGLPCHASAPWRGLNAIDVARELLVLAAELDEQLPRHDWHGKGTLSPLGIASDPYDGGVLPDRCSVILKRRLILGETYQSALEGIHALLRRVRDRLPTATLEIQPPRGSIRTYTGLEFAPVPGEFARPWLLDSAHPLVRTAVETIRQVIGGEPKLGCWDFGTHGVITSAAWGIPTIGLAPGREDVTHTPEDHVRIDELVDAVAIYAALAAAIFA